LRAKGRTSRGGISGLVRPFVFGPTQNKEEKKMIKRLLKEENGQTMVEYGLLIALISIAVIAVLIALGPRIATFFQSVDDQLAANQPPAPPVP